MRRPKVKSVSVVAKTWRDKKFGNTYNSTDVLVNGDLVARLPFAYGGGSMPEQRAVEWLVKNGFIHAEEYKHGGYPSLWRLAEDLNFSKYVDTTSVSRKNDLYHEPKSSKR
jgi:hypothetical protein